MALSEGELKRWKKVENAARICFKITFKEVENTDVDMLWDYIKKWRILWKCFGITQRRADKSLHQALQGYFGRIKEAAKSPTLDDLPGSDHHLPCQSGLSTLLVADTQNVELRQSH